MAVSSSFSSSRITQAVLLGAIVLITCGAAVVDGERGETNQREFDYFKLALQWPGTYCRRTRHCCSKNGCCRGSNSPAEFTIHGLWPDYNDGTWPACCSRSPFNEKEISTLLNALEKYWPSLSCGSPSTCHGKKGSFWAHEGVLCDAGYLPSNTEKYPIGGIISAIQNAFHVTPQVACSNGALEEVYLCFYKDFKPRECAVGSIIPQDINLSKSSCPKYVSLPAYTSRGQEKNIWSAVGQEKNIWSMSSAPEEIEAL